MRKITPHLWFDKQAKEAAELYTRLFPDSRITNITTLHNTPSGDCDLVSFELSREPFMAISAGPIFKFNPSVSFQVKYGAKDQLNATWEKLVEGGKILMPLDSYPFSERFGWLEDRYGLSWQLTFAGEVNSAQKITPMLLFVGKVCGKTEEAMDFYTSVFRNSPGATGNTGTNVFARYGKGEGPDQEGTVKYATFALRGQDFAAMDSAHQHKFAFNEAISFLVPCENQEEIDYFWGQLSSDPKAEQCGWLKDKYGLSWQVGPAIMGEMLGSGDQEAIARVTQAFLKMKKFDIATLKKAYEGKP
jgi:predicted 3-demethylubiquinone-9 3-methyltransferase (glyoxalase superfamily)